MRTSAKGAEGARAQYDSRPDTYAHIDKVRGYLTDVACKLLWRAQVHDASKLADPELEAFDRMTPLLATLTYGTDEYKQSLKDLGPALAHHYAANSHHPEHYENGVAGMSLLDLVEMLVDWKAAALRTQNAGGSDFARSIALNQERFGYTDELRSVLENTARELGFTAPRSGATQKGSR